MTAVRRPPLWGAALLMATLISLISCGGGDTDTAVGTAAENNASNGPTINLYFPGEGGLLYPDPRELDLAGTPEERVRAVVEALLAGPESESLQPIFDRPAEVVGVYLSNSGLAYIDLAPAGTTSAGEGDGETDADEGTESAPEVEVWTPEAGSLQEIQMAYSLVNSVVLNVPEVTRVVPLWMGEQSMTFAGHLDTSRPLAASPDLIVRPDADPQA